MEFNRKWLTLCREKLKENGTIWISGTHHNLFVIANVLQELGYKILRMDLDNLGVKENYIGRLSDLHHLSMTDTFNEPDKEYGTDSPF